MNLAAMCILEINLARIRANYTALHHQVCKSAEIGAVIKSNSYGLGTKWVAPALYKVGCSHFFVSSIEEAIEARQVLPVEADIFVLFGVFENDKDYFIEYNITPVLNNLAQVMIWSNYAHSQHKKLPALLHIDTGMTRLGMSITDLKQLSFNKKELLNNIDLKYVISHLSASDQINSQYNLQQLLTFQDITSTHFPGAKVSLVSTGGIFLGQNYHFDLVRSGAGLYGINKTAQVRNVVQQVISLSAPIIQLDTVPTNTPIGYNMTFITTQETKVATLPFGYADGYSRLFSNRGITYIAGYAAPVVGTISMDLTTIDVTNVPQEYLFLGQKVDIIDYNHSINDLAIESGTSGLEILVSLGNKCKKIYKDHDYS